MRNRRAKSPDALARLFLDVAGEVPDDTSLLRMRRISGALNLRDNDALWSMIAVLEYYARLYEAMPDRIRKAGDGGFDAVRRETEEAADTLMRQHRDALARLADHERLEAFVTQAAQHVDGRDVGVACRAAFVLAVCEDGRGDAMDLIVRQRRVGTEHRGAVTERGSELHDYLHSKRVE